MKLSRRSCELYANNIKAISEVAERSFVESIASLPWDGVDIATLEANRDYAIAKIFQNIETYGNAAAAEAADFFEAVASSAGRKALAVGADIAEVADFVEINASARWAAGSLFTETGIPDVAAFSERCSGAITRMVMKAANETIVNSAKANKMPVKWARIVTDAKACDDCIRLASYGFTWDEGDFFEIHDHCHCAFVPGFGDDPQLV